MPQYQRIVWVGLAVAALAILALAYFLFLAPAGETRKVIIPETASLAKPGDQTAKETAEESDSAIVPLDLDLDRSDEAVRTMVAAGEIPVVMKKWLRQKDIVRTGVAAIDSIARGESPAALLPFLAPEGKFLAAERNGSYTLDPRSYRRYDPLVNAFTAVPDKTLVTWYKTLRPTLEKAFRELGYPNVTFAQRVQQAIEQLTQTPLPHEEAALERKVLSYAYGDPDLESLNPAQKHLLRFGPRNAARIQDKLRSLAAALKFTGKK
ncbi:MAG: DUF3014 domain-containing protein [Acidobacteriota bacterium]|jgi:hypothetical protein|nr:DUF3014 domain-containing protein [Acidobacteriota bacterium]